MIRSPLLILAACLSVPSAALADGLSPVPPRAELFPLNDVRLLDSPFKAAQATDLDYLLQLEPDRFLSWFRKEAGLPSKAEVYHGWEDRGVAGHSLGHYLSALSAMWQATGDERLKARIDYIVDELALCQQANGNGWVGAIPDGKKVFAEIATGKITTKTPFDLNNTWVPWYTMHKVFAGLIDAYERAGNLKARQVVVKLGDWCRATVDGLTDEQMQHMLSTEQGGIAESMAEIAAITNDPKFMATAKKFRHAAVFDPLARGEDKLTGIHGNTQIPKMIGYDRIYELTGDQPYGTVARNFWNFVVHDRSFATGGHGTHESFFPPARFRENMLTTVGPETCNTYNMLKLTERLFTEQPTGEMMDYYERAVYNHILCSQAPGKPGELSYYTSMRPGAYHTYSRPTEDFWCCVGTGMENHARYGEVIYAREGDDKLLVNLFIPSELHYQGTTLRQDTNYPMSGQSKLTFSALPQAKTFTVAVRYPGWAAPGALKLSVNGEPVPSAAQTASGQYAEVRREWKTGDVLTVDLPLQIRTEPLPDTEGYVAIFYGPVLLAGDLGRDGLKDGDFLEQIANEKKQLSAAQVPVLLASAADLTHHLTLVDGSPLTFVLRDIVKPREVTLRPFYELATERYAIYWRLTTPEKYAEEVKALEAVESHQRELAARTVDGLTPGEQQLDVDHNVKMEGSRTGLAMDRRYRDAWDGGWFSYEMKVSPDKPVKLLCTYWGGEGLERQFDIYVDKEKIASQNLHNNQPGKFFDVEYPVPTSLTQGKSKVTVRFQAVPRGVAGGIFDLRMVQ